MIITWTTTLRKFLRCTLWLDSKQSIQKVNQPLIFFQNYLRYTLPVQNINIKEHDVHTARTLSPASPDQLSLHFRSTDRHYLAPNGLACIFWVPMKLQEENIAFIIGQDNTTVTFCDVEHKTLSTCGLMSRGTMYATTGSTKYQYVYLVDILGLDASSLKKHVAKHLLHVKEQIKGCVHFCVHFQDDIDYELIISTLNDFDVDESRLYEGCRDAPCKLDIYDVNSYNVINSFLSYFKRRFNMWSWM